MLRKIDRSPKISVLIFVDLFFFEYAKRSVDALYKLNSFVVRVTSD